MPYTDVASIHSDPTDPLPAHERTMALRELDAAAVDALLDLVGPGTDCEQLLVEVRHLGGALGREPEHPNAVGNRDAAFNLFMIGVAPPGQENALFDYADKVLDRMEPWGTGGRYLNFLAARTPPGFIRDAYTPEAYKRLVALKSAYDPRNVFRINHNIPPSGATNGYRDE
jgi:FAD/FMN-containing dehydrogenase